MTINMEDLLSSILGSLDRLEYIRSEDIPDIDLYMDQVTTFMEAHLKSSVRNPLNDKILTKTMINNYAKNDLLPPPVRKKYSKDHVLLLIFIYYYKGILSISDIQELLKPIKEQFFDNREDFNLSSVYEEVLGLELNQTAVMKEDLEAKFQTAQKSFADAPEDSQEFLRIFSFICMLSFDVYIKTLLIEKMIDGFVTKKTEKEHKKTKAQDKQNKKEETGHSAMED